VSEVLGNDFKAVIRNWEETGIPSKARRKRVKMKAKKKRPKVITE